MQIVVRHNLQVYDPDDTSLREEDAIVLPVREAQAVMGETVNAYLSRVAWRFDLPTVCRINGEYYGRAEWECRALAVNDNVEFVSRPLGSQGGRGSSGKSVISILAMLTLTAIAGPAGGLAAGALGFTVGGFAYAAASAVVGAAIVGAGALAISHFLSPKSAGKSTADNPLYQFGLSGNAARPTEPCPVLNGRLRFAPEFAAPTYSEYAGDAMLDYALFFLTCGKMRVEQVLIGDTPIWHYQTGYNPDYPGIEIQVAGPGEQVTLYPVNVVTAEELQGASLTTTFTPDYIVNAAGTLAKTLLVDFVWPGGAYITYKDRQLAAATHILVEARTVDAAGAPTGAWTTVFSKVYQLCKQSQIRVTERIAVTPGRYAVRARRVNPSVQDSGVAKIAGTDDVTWTALRAHIDGPQTFPRCTVLAVKGIASKNLSGISGGQLRVIGTRILPVWSGSGFVEQPTRSIAWAVLDWWRNSDYSAGLPLDTIDFATLLAYDALWASLGHSFDFRFTQEQTLDDVLETVLKAGRAIPAAVGDRLSIVREEPRGLPRTLFTENDIEAGSLAINYALADEAWADGIVGVYLDETSWRMAEVSSAPDGVVLRNPARVQLEGIVSRKQATGVVRFMAAESQYRRITVDWTARMEGRLLKRGDLVKISAEEPETWGQSAEIVASSADGLSLTLDPPPVWEASGNHYVEIRRRDGRPWGPVRVTKGASDAIALVDENDASRVAGEQGFALVDVIARSDVQERPWLAFSPGQPRKFPVLITEGTPEQDGEHIALTGVLDAPEVYTTTETGVPPLITPPALASNALPLVLRLTAAISQRALSRVLTAGWQPDRNAAAYYAEITYDSQVSWTPIYSGEPTTFEASVGAASTVGSTYLRVCGITASGVNGRFTVVPVEAPDLIVSGDFLSDLSVEIKKLTAQAQKDIADVSDIGRGLLTLDQQTGNVGIDLAHDTIRGGMQQLAKAIERLAEAAATDQTNSFEQRQLIRVGTSDNYAAIQREQVARIAVDSATASITDSLAAQLTALDGRVTANAGALSSLSATVTSIDGRVTAQGQALTALTSRVDAHDLSLSGQATAQQALTTRVTVAEGNISSNASAITFLQSTVSTQGGQISGNASAISTLITRANTVDGQIYTQAMTISTLQTSVGSNTAALTTYGSSIDGLKVQYGVTGYVDGQTGGFVFTGVKRNDGAVSFTVAISGSLIVSGSVTASALNILTVSAISANLGTITAGKLQSPDGKFVADTSNKYIAISDG